MRAAVTVCMLKYTYHVRYQNIRWDKDGMKVAWLKASAME